MDSVERPIFIVGAPRSGTSFLRVALSRHPRIDVCDETRFFYKVWARRRAFGDLAVPELRRRLTAKFLDTGAIRSLGLERSALASALEREGTTYRNFFGALLRESARQRGKQRFGEKTPRHALYSNVLCDWFPHCTLIHIVRDPRDVAASLKRMPFGAPDALANARTWLTHVRAAMRMSARSNFLLVKYEQLVEEPEAELRRILSVVGEDYSPSLLEGRAPERSVEWYFERSHAPLDPTRRGSWRHELSSEEAGIVEWAAGAEMSAFGYVPQMEPPSAAARSLAMCGTAVNAALDKSARLRTLWFQWVSPTDFAGEEAAWTQRDAIRSAQMALWEQLKSLVTQQPLARYALATITAMLMVGVRWVLDPLLSPGPSYFLYFPGILLIAFAFGLGPSLAATSVAALGAYVLFSDPVWGVRHDLGEDVRLLLFVTLVSGLAYGAARLSDRLRRLEQGGLAHEPEDLRRLGRLPASL